MSKKTRGIIVESFQRVIESLRARTRKPRKDLALILPELHGLCEELRLAAKERDTLTGLVRFLNATSTWHDRGVYGLIGVFHVVNENNQYGEMIANLRELQKAFVEAGRNEWQMNRTHRGQVVTEDKVWLGSSHYGLSPQPVPYWRNKRKEKREHSADPQLDKVNAYEFVCLEARKFMDDHATRICGIIQEIQAGVI